MRCRTWLPLAAVILLTHCGDNDLGIDKRRPNRAPVTHLSSGPPDSTYDTNYRVHFFWAGVDPDGTIDHYDCILVDHPAANDSIAASSSDYARRVVVEMPAVDDPRWTSTLANDSVVVTRADTLRHRRSPPPDPTETQLWTHNDFVRHRSFERWHTFFVRAVDDQGLPDATPAYRSFNSRTLAPTVALKRPVTPGLQYRGPRVTVFGWDGVDDAGDGTFRAPIASRWTLLRSSYAGLVRDWPQALYELPESAWSPWHRWDASDGSGTRAVVRNHDPPGGDPGFPGIVGFYFFAVQAMDEAGAVTPVFDDFTPGNNNATRFSIADQSGPTLTIADPRLGTFVFTSGSRPVTLDLATGQDLRLRWNADASQYGGEVVAYRFGWNVRDPHDEGQWEQTWSATARSAPPRALVPGTHRFLVEARDNVESVTSATIEFVVYRPTLRHDLLYVDDSHHPQGDQDPAEAMENLRWMAVFDELLLRRSFDWRPDRDAYQADAAHLPPIQLLFDYKTVVWNHIGSDRNTALRVLANFFDPFLESNRGRVPAFNYLNVYLESGGEVWLSGQQTTYLLWPVTRRPLREQPNPVNVTNWDDPQQPHPEQDSAGVGSLLYRMGIEAFVLGGGGGGPTPRTSIQHGCRGFSRGTPEGFETQVFTSNLSLLHVHRLTIPTADVDAPADRVYVTAAELDHRHEVAISAQEFSRLQRGEHLGISASSSDLPQPHVHAFDLADQVGLWGGPPALQVQDSQWAVPASPIANPQRTRPNVEILNMPQFLGSRTPPLAPAPDVWLPLYNYVSGVPSDPGAPTPVVYPLTADGQPALILRRPFPGAPQYTRAYCGFEPWRLTMASHVALADFVLLRHFRLGLPGAAPAAPRATHDLP